jgi:hypothetical protein
MYREAARYETTRRLRAAEDERRRRLARPPFVVRRFRVARGAETMC